MNKIIFEALPSTKIPLSPSILNTMQENIETSIRGTRSSVTLTQAIPQNTNYTIPFSYVVR